MAKTIYKNSKKIVGLLPKHHSKDLFWWVLLALTSLAIAGIFAILLVLSRAPITETKLPWPSDFFSKGLVAHVTLSFIVWFLAVFGCMMTSIISQIDNSKGNKNNTTIDIISIFLVFIGTLALLIPPFYGSGEPSLNNYVPVIIDPIYYTGLAIFTLGILSSVVRFLLTFPQINEEMRGEAWLLLSGGILFILGLVAIFISGSNLNLASVDFDFNETLFWGGGHIFQVLNLSLFFSAITILYKLIYRQQLAPINFFVGMTSILLVIGLINLSLYSIFDFNDPQLPMAFTKMQFALGVPVVVLFSWLGFNIYKNSIPKNSHKFAFLSLSWSLSLFSIGMILALFVDGQDTRTPAHYHAVIGGINVAFVGIFYCWIFPLIGKKLKFENLIKAQIILYSLGQCLFVIGMFITGTAGASRKIMGPGIELDNLFIIIVTLVKDVGGGLAIIGGGLFIFLAFFALFSQTSNSQ